MSTNIQRRPHARISRKPRRSAHRVHLWPGIATMLLLAAFGTLGASNHVPRALAKVTAQLSAPAKAAAPAATPAAAPFTVAAYVAPQASNNPALPSSSPSTPPASSPSDGGDWILAPDDLPPTPPTGDVLPLPVAHSAQDIGFHPVKVQHEELAGDRVILTCLNPETGNTETITGKQGRDTVFILKNPEAADLPTSQIKDVEPGNLVATRNPQSGKTEFGRVVSTIKRFAPSVVTVTLLDSKAGSTETLTCTPEHPFFTQGGGWVEAGSLGIGTNIVSRAGPALQVTGLIWKRDTAKALSANARVGSIPVYNLTVEGDHTFFVGTRGGGTWVHNICPGSNAQFGKKFGEHMEDYPGMTHQDYRNLADSIYDDPAAVRKFFPADQGGAYAGETHITRGSDLLRLDPNGNFRSLYPGVDPSTGTYIFRP